MSKTISKIIFEIKICTKTGLHIGASGVGMEIGGIDGRVIKTHAGTPYIPGSSLKGKLRFLLEHEYGKDDEKIKKLFGVSADINQGNDLVEDEYLTRLIFRDLYMDRNDEDSWQEIKTENVITYENGVLSATPRTNERVRTGVNFMGEIILTSYGKDDNNALDQYEERLRKGIQILETDYLGGNGTRGYGQVTIELKQKSTLRKK